MLASFQMHDGRARGWQPQVLHIHHLLAVNLQIMATGHLLTHIEQQGIVALLGNLQLGTEDVTLSHLLLSTLGSGDVDYLRGEW